MRVDEPGKRQAAGQLDDLGPRSGERPKILVGAHGDDALAADRHRRRLGPSWVDGPYAASAQDEVGRFGRAQPARRRALRPAR